MALLWSVFLLIALAGASTAYGDGDNGDGVNVKPCTRWYDFDITYGVANPDNYPQNGTILINGKYPGPTIRVVPTDTLCVKVTNNLDHGFVIHWHGILQRTSKNADGVGNVTQQPIEPGDSYLYRIDINGQHGTYAYHAHQRLDILWVQGVFIIEDKQILAGHRAYDYDEEFTVMFSQCWHTNINTLLGEIPALPTASSVLINGRSYGNWSATPDDVDDDDDDYDKGYVVFNVKQHRTYRFRFIAITDDSGGNCTISGHNLTIIETDGTITNPVPTDHLQVNIIQRYSILLRTNQSIGNYIIRCALINGGPANGVAILHYEGAPDPTPLRTVPLNQVSTPASEFDLWVLEQLRPSTILPFQPLVYDIPKKVDKTIIIEHEFNITANRFTVNNETFIFPPENYLKQFYENEDFHIYESIQYAKVGQTVEIIFQNKDIVPGFSLQHPWHQHGTTFYEVAHGSDRFDEETDRELINSNIRNHFVRFGDVIILFVNTTLVNGTELDPGYSGWTAIRFIANNPGVWLTHCHITPHLLIGKVYLLHVSNFECSKAGYFADPSDCRYFYHCVADQWGGFQKPERAICPSGLFFDDTIPACQYPNLVKACRYQQQAVPKNPQGIDW